MARHGVRHPYRAARGVPPVGPGPMFGVPPPGAGRGAQRFLSIPNTPRTTVLIIERPSRLFG